MNDVTSPSLAPPGAGLPPLEMVVARLLFKRYRRRNRREELAAHIQEERALIRAGLRGICEADAQQPILIKRLPGMEDSSRFWSLCMVVHHLEIVNRGVAEAISALGNGQIPARQVDTAAVKPMPGIGMAVLETFEESCEALNRAIAGVANPRTKVRYAHPWFGPLDALSWYAMAAFHMRLHRKQMDRIREGLGVS